MRAGQRDGVLLLFLAVFLFCLAVVPGQSLWGAIQGFLLGVFGWCVFLWIGLLVYFAVLLFLRRVQKPQVVRGVQLALFILLLSSALHILGHDTVGMGWAEDLKDAYGRGRRRDAWRNSALFWQSPCRCNGDLADARRFDAAVLADDCRAFAGAGGKSAVAA